MKNLTQKYNNKNILIISVIFLAGFLGFFTALGNIKLLILFCLGFLAILIVIKPFYGLLFSIPLVMWFSYTDLLWISAWNYILAFLIYLCILILVKKQKLRINKYSQRILIIFISFIFLAIIINWINGISFDAIFLMTGKLISTLLLAFCTMFFIKNENQLKTFLYFLIGCMSISALVGIGQFLGIDIFWKLREISGIDPEHIVGQQILQRSRIPGLAYYSIPFSYQLASTVPLIFGMLALKKKSFYLAITFIICFLALLASLIKSATLGAIIGLFVIVYLRSNLKIKVNKIKIFNFVVFLILIFLIFNILTGNSFYQYYHKQIFKPTVSTLSRIPLSLAGFKIFASNPFGIGMGQYSKYGAEFLPELSHMPGAEKILTTATHNQFLNILIYYGILGLLFLLIFYYYIFKGLFYLYRNNESIFLAGVIVGLIGSFSSYIINSMFHNQGAFTVDPFNWYFIGVVMFLLNNYKRLSGNGDNIATTKN